MVVGSFLLVLFLTLFPFNFQLGNDVAWQHLLENVNNSTTAGDFFVNVPFFIPWGISLTYLLHRKRLQWQIILPFVLVGSASLSLFVEILQIFVPSRVSSPADVLANSLGGLLGWLCFYLFRWAILSGLNKSILLRSLIISFLGYLILHCFLSMPLERFSTLKIWNANFPLVLGNENTGDRPWKGYISELLISDRALEKDLLAASMSSPFSLNPIQDSAIAYYQFFGKEKYQDRTAHLPRLIWRGKLLTQSPEKKGILFDGNSWLATETPAKLLTEKTTKTSEFSIIATVATNDLEQTGPARIISFSSDPLQCNFTIGQARHNLIFRLRTPLTGYQGTQPEIVIPNVFTNLLPHRLLFTYANSVVEIYVDTPNNLQRLTIVPGTVLMSYLLPKKAYNIDNFMLLYYGFVFVPLGCFLGAIYLLLKGNFPLQILLFTSGIILPAFLFEASLTSGQIRYINANNFLLDMAIATIAMSSVYFGTRCCWRYLKLD
jgi:glycopeptide antibiotics resistance protein